MFYDNFIKACTMRGISPSIAAEEIGFDRSAVTGWKKGSKPKDTTVRKIADYFGISPEELTGSTGPAQHNVPAVPQPGAISEDDIKAAFFNGADPSLTKEEQDAMWDDAREYMWFKLEQRRRQKQHEK